jgi:hypothetical protein
MSFSLSGRRKIGKFIAEVMRGVKRIVDWPVFYTPLEETLQYGGNYLVDTQCGNI